MLRAAPGILLVSVFLGIPAAPAAAQLSTTMPVVVKRDARGVAHVHALNDVGAYYGLGYATAEDRFLQMTLGRLMMDGRLAEHLGRDAAAPNDQLYLQHDRLVRVYGYRRLAQKLYAQMPAQDKQLLNAYAAGVNRYLFPPGGLTPVLHPFFSGVFLPRLGATVTLPVEPWTPIDSITAWMRLARLYTPVEPAQIVRDTHDYETWLASGGVVIDGIGVGGNAVLLSQLFPPRVFDPVSAPVPAEIDEGFEQRTDEVAALAWLQAQPCSSSALSFLSGGGGSFVSGTFLVGGFLDDVIYQDQQLLSLFGDELARPNFSHAWAVAGDGQGRPAVLLGDPRVEVRVPNDLYEGSMSSPTFSVRGAMTPGSPNMLVGSNGHVAWSVTSLRMQQSDPFELVVDVTRPDEYLLDGVWTPMSVSTETIKVLQSNLSHTSETLRYRESVWGPVVTRFPGDRTLATPAASANEEFAVRWVPFHDPTLDPTRGFRDLYRVSPAAAALQGKTTAELFVQRLGGWSWPAVHLIFAETGGRVGYATVGRLPLRSCISPVGALIAQDGSTLEAMWAALVPPEYLPWVIKEPRADSVAFVHNGNNAPIDGDWYPIPFVSQGGDTSRSRRLRERLQTLEPGFALEQVFEIHEDSVWVYGRDIVRLGLHLRDNQGFTGFTPEAHQVLQFLDEWADAAGNEGQLTASLPAESFMAQQVGLIPFRVITAADELLEEFGAGDAGLNHFLREMAAATADPAYVLSPASASYIATSLHTAFILTRNRSGGSTDPSVWAAAFMASLNKNLTQWDPLETAPNAVNGNAAALPPLISATVPVGPLKATFGLTLFSQLGQLYSQFVELRSPNNFAAKSLLAVGQAEIPASPFAFDQLATWATGPGQTQVWAHAPLGPPFAPTSVITLFH